MLALRFLKLIAVLALAAGTVGAFLPQSLDERRRSAFWIVGPGFFATWIAGIVLAWSSGVSLLAAWIVGSMVSSIVSINVVLWSVGREGRRTGIAASIAIATLLLSLALMVWKPVLD